jgi:tetratricopeptide (TPR) repeat protein
VFRKWSAHMDQHVSPGNDGKARRGERSGSAAPAADDAVEAVEESWYRGGGSAPAARPRRARRGPGPALPRPPLPAERPRLPKEAYGALKSTVPRASLQDVAAALAVATQRAEEGDDDVALRYLGWAKEQAPRSEAVREALGVMLYRLGRFPEALKELTAYRRLSAREDQNHLLADCARATGAADRVEGLVLAAEEGGVAPERLVEAHIVLAGTRADTGDLEGAWRALQRSELSPAVAQPWHARLWEMAAELCRRVGDGEAAQDYLDAAEALGSEGRD